MKRAICLASGEGRAYACGSMRAIFKADGSETANAYSVSEWWLEPFSSGPGPHQHDASDEIFLVIEGTPRLLVGEEWISASTGTFVRVPAGTVHDFDNPGSTRAGLFAVFIPGGFEKQMPAIVEWFEKDRAHRASENSPSQSR